MSKYFLAVILLLSVACLGTVSIDRIDASEFPLVCFQVTTTGHYSAASFNFSEDGVTIAPSIQLVQKEPLKTIKVYYFLDISGSMNSRLTEIIGKLAILSRAIREISEGEVKEHFIAISDKIVREIESTNGNTQDVLMQLYSLPIAVDEDFGKVLNSYDFDEGSIAVIVDDRGSWKEKPTSTIMKSGVPFIALDTGSEYAKELAKTTAGLIFDGENLAELETLLSSLSRSIWELKYNSPFPDFTLHTIELNGITANYVNSMKEPVIIPKAETVEATAGERLELEGKIKGKVKRFKAYYQDTSLEIKVLGQEYYLEVIPQPGIKKLVLKACSSWKCVEKEVNIIGLETRPALEVKIDWNEPNADLDLYVNEPTNTVYFLNDKANGFLSNDCIKGPGRETYIINPKGNFLPHGKYRIRVHYYRGRVPVEFRVTIYSYGRLLLDEEFKLEISDSRNCIPDAEGPDWLDVMNIDF